MLETIFTKMLHSEKSESLKKLIFAQDYIILSLIMFPIR